MPRNFRDLEEKVAGVSSYVSSVQIDLMDGKFVPQKTWPFFSYNDPDFAALLSENKGLPEWEKIDYEADLMTSSSDADLFDWIKIGVKRIILHVESTNELPKLIEEIRAEYGRPNKDPLAPEIGLAANNDTPLEIWEKHIPLVDFVQVMGIAKIGFQGEPFDERSLGRIRELRRNYPKLMISVDGGVNEERAVQLVRAGANRLVSGSYIFENGNMKAAIEGLRNLS